MENNLAGATPPTRAPAQSFAHPLYPPLDIPRQYSPAAPTSQVFPGSLMRPPWEAASPLGPPPPPLHTPINGSNALPWAPPLTLGSAPNNNPAQWDAFAGLTKPPAVMPPKGAAKAPAKAPARKRTTSQAAPAPAAVAFPPGITTRAQKAAFVATSGSAPAVPAAPPSAPPVTTAPPTSQAPAGIDLDAYSGALDADMAAQFANLSDASLVSAGPDSSVSLSSASASASSSSSAGLFQNATL